eukprot:scaffold191_cov273-Chaetoceros_neogracile.AAC.53
MHLINGLAAIAINIIVPGPNFSTLTASIEVKVCCKFKRYCIPAFNNIFCDGIGTESDTTLHFTVQIFTAGSIVRALCDSNTSLKVLSADDGSEEDDSNGRGALRLPFVYLGRLTLPVVFTRRTSKGP